LITATKSFIAHGQEWTDVRGGHTNVTTKNRMSVGGSSTMDRALDIHLFEKM
jgi:hypothetical protein